MVKKGKSNFSIPNSWAGSRSLPDAPPGFSAQPLRNSASTPAAAQSSKSQNPTSMIDKVRRVYRNRSISSEQQSTRRTSRKRSRPQFYAPSPAQLPTPTPRRRGRPSRARLVSQFSCQETKTKNPNSTHSGKPQEPVPCFIRSLQTSKEQSSSDTNSQLFEEVVGSELNRSPSSLHSVGRKTNMKQRKHEIVLDINQARATKRSTSQTHDIDETLFDISLTECPGSVVGYERVRNFDSENQSSPGIDPKILQHVANALQYISGSQTAIDDSLVKLKSSDIDKNLANTLKAINKRHGDITRGSLLESDCMKTLVLLGICKVVQDLEKKQLKDVDIGALDSYYTTVRDAENMKVNVRWLHDRLDEIKDAVKFTDEEQVLVDEKNRRLENLDIKKKDLLMRKGELERLKSKIQDIESQMAREVLMVEELNRKIVAQQSRFSRFQHAHLMDGLV